MGVDHVNCELLCNIGQCSSGVGKSRGLEREKVLVSLLVAESVEMEGIFQHEIFRMQ